MNKILKVNEAIKIAQKLREQNKTIVLVGGCFDIIHIGHIKLLEKAKTLGNVLIVLLENDKNVRKIKGKNRPINSQKNRAYVLEALKPVDFVVMLPNMQSDFQYDKIIGEIKPSIIATTINDPDISHKIRQAKKNNAKVIPIIKRVSNQSTTRLAKLIEEENL